MKTVEDLSDLARGSVPSRNRKVLFLAYPYPPMGLAGTFRVVRFVKYLPLYGWTPLVVTVCPEEIPSYGRDDSLYDYVPAETVVRRTSMLRPLNSVLRVVNRCLRPMSRNSRNSDVAASKSCEPRNRSSTASSTSLVRGLRELKTALCDYA